MLGNLAAAYAHDIDGLEVNLAAGRRHPQEFSPVRPMIGFVRGHAVAISELPMNVGLKVGKRSSQDFVELPRPVLVRRASRLWRVIEKVIGES